MKYLTSFSRLFIGVLFIISGLVKLNDPMGFGFKLQEYFAPDVLNLPFLDPIALQIAIFVVVVEVVVGALMLLGYRIKLTLWVSLLMIVFFSFLTFYSAYFNKVTDCGCFGDAIPLKPWQSFGKDMVFLVFILIMMAGQKYIKPFWSERANRFALAAVLVFCAGLGYTVLNHLPIIDFRVYAEGKSIVDGMKSAEELGLKGPEYEVIYTMKNTKNGEQIEITGSAYVDDKWWENSDWEMLEDLTRDEKISEGYEPPVHDFAISTDMGDITEEILQAENYILIISYRLDKADRAGFEHIANVMWEMEGENVPVLALSSSAPEDAEQLKHDIQAPFEFGSMDETTLKTIIRSNPGVVWLKKGVVFKKWHFNDVPTANELKQLK